MKEAEKIVEVVDNRNGVMSMRMELLMNLRGPVAEFVGGIDYRAKEYADKSARAKLAAALRGIRRTLRATPATRQLAKGFAWQPQSTFGRDAGDPCIDIKERGGAGARYDGAAGPYLFSPVWRVAANGQFLDAPQKWD